MNSWETGSLALDGGEAHLRQQPVAVGEHRPPRCPPKAPPRLRPREFRPLTPRERQLAEALAKRSRLCGLTSYISRKNPTDREDKQVGQLRALHRALSVHEAAGKVGARR